MTVPAAGTKANGSSANGSSNDRATQAAEFGAAAGGRTEASSASALPAAGAAAPAARVAQAASWERVVEDRAAQGLRETSDALRRGDDSAAFDAANETAKELLNSIPEGSNLGDFWDAVNRGYDRVDTGSSTFDRARELIEERLRERSAD